MIYSRRYFRILLTADADCRAMSMTPRIIIKELVIQTCRKLGCRLEALAVGNGAVEILVDICTALSINDFLQRLARETASCIQEGSGADFEPADYWQPDHLLQAISPEDAPSAAEEIARALSVTEPCERQNAENRGGEAGYWHHLIMVTEGASMKLPMKHRAELESAMNAICSGLGIEECRSAAMRNHVHLLFKATPDTVLTPFIEEFSKRLTEWLLGNAHYRQFKDWHKDVIIYAVSQRRLSEENSNLDNQHRIHSFGFTPNEMSHLYPRLRLPYLYQLN